MELISEENLKTFKKDGILVIENVLSEDEVQQARSSLHNDLKLRGLDHQKIINMEIEPPRDIRKKGNASDIFYSKWKMIDIHLNKNIYQYPLELMRKTFGIKEKGFDHPYSKFNNILCYIDRVCWRLPDHILTEGGLGLHLDRNPVYPYTSDYKWRPIQAFVALTDHYNNESGGLKVVKGFHNEIDEYFKGSTVAKNEKGSFFRMNNPSHEKLNKRCETVYVPKGSLVMWDNRLPHATCDKLISNDSREVVYLGYLPDIELNRKYCQKQLKAIEENKIPPAYSKDENDMYNYSIDWDFNQLDQEQLKMMCK